MKKIVALTLAMLLLLSGCGAGANGYGVAVNNIAWSLQVADMAQGGLDRFSAGLELGQNEQAMGVRLHFDLDGEAYAQAVVILQGDDVVMMLEGASGPIGTYVLEKTPAAPALRQLFETVLSPEEMDLRQLIEAVLFPTGSAALGEETEDIHDYVDGQLGWQIGGMLALDEEALEQMLARRRAAVDELAALIESCYRPGDPTQLDGVRYDTAEISIDNDTLMEFFALAGGQEMAEVLEMTGLGMCLTGDVYMSQEAMRMQLVMDVDLLGQPQLTGSAGVDGGPVEDVSWLDVDTDGAARLTEMDEQVMGMLLDRDAETFLEEILNGIMVAAEVPAKKHKG